MKARATARPTTTHPRPVSLTTSSNALAACKFIASIHPQFRFSQWRFLLVVAENPGLSQREVARRLDVTDAAISRAIDTLGPKGRKDRRNFVGRNFVEVKLDPLDDRTKYLFITPSGLSFLEQIEDHLWNNK